MQAQRQLIPGVRTEGDIPGESVGAWLSTDLKGRCILEVSAGDAYDSAEIDLEALVS